MPLVNYSLAKAGKILFVIRWLKPTAMMAVLFYKLASYAFSKL